MLRNAGSDALHIAAARQTDQLAGGARFFYACSLQQTNHTPHERPTTQADGHRPRLGDT